MLELLQFSIHPYNFVLTLLLGLILLYWITVMLGVLDLDVLDVEGPDMDADLDADLDGDMDSELESGGFATNLAGFLFLGQVPLTVIASMFVLWMWILTVMGNYLLHTDSWKMAALVMLAAMILSFVLSRLCLYPLRAIFHRMSAEEQQLKNVLGLSCTVLAAADDHRLGQAETEAKGAFVRINIRTQPGVRVEKGDRVRVVAKDGPHAYIVEPERQ